MRSIAWCYRESRGCQENVVYKPKAYLGIIFEDRKIVKTGSRKTEFQVEFGARHKKISEQKYQDCGKNPKPIGPNQTGTARISEGFLNFRP